MTPHEYRRVVTAAIVAAVLTGVASVPNAHAIEGGQVVVDSAYWENFFNNLNRAVVGIGGTGVGSGLLVAPRLVLTAGHCGRSGNLAAKAPGGPVGFGPTTSYAETINASDEIDHYDICVAGNCPDKIDIGLWVLDKPATYALPYWAIGDMQELEPASFFGYGDDAGKLKAADCLVTDLWANGNSNRYVLACGGQDSEGGDSGGPVFDAQLGLAGVNRGEAPDPQDAYGIRLTPDVVYWVNQRIWEYATVLRMGDFDGDGRADFFHWNPNDHSSFQDQANGSYANPTSWPDGKPENIVSWCAQQLHIGRFNGDAKDDLLCHDFIGDKLYLNYADMTGKFGTLGEVERTHTWCNGEVYVGDFNADGFDDLFCRQPSPARKIILNTQNPADPFPNASTWIESADWCGQKILVGAFDGDGDDVLCWNPGGGFYYRRGQPDGSLGPTTFWASSWCANGDILVGDLNDDEKDDLLCWNKSAKWIAIDMSTGVTRTSPQPFGNPWANQPYFFCEGAAGSNSVTGRLADVSGDGRADFACHDQRTGQVWLDLAEQAWQVFDGATDLKVPDVPTPIWP